MLVNQYILRCKKDNIVHTEIFFDPQSHTTRGIDFNVVISGIYKALTKANSEFGITSKIISRLYLFNRFGWNFNFISF